MEWLQGGQILCLLKYKMFDFDFVSKGSHCYK